jgi:hypothetical protein
MGDENEDTTLSEYNKIFGSISDPLFMVASGILTPQDLADMMKYLTYEPVSTDWQSMKQENQYSDGTPIDTLLAEAYNQVEQYGLRPESVRIWIMNQLPTRNGQISNSDMDKLESWMSFVDEFSKRFEASIDVASPDAKGYIWDSATGSWLKPLADDVARQNLRDTNLEGLFSLPETWRIIPDAVTQQEAMALADRAEQLGKTADKAESGMWKAVSNAAKEAKASFWQYRFGVEKDVAARNTDVALPGSRGQMEGLSPSELPKGTHPNSPAARDLAQRMLQARGIPRPATQGKINTVGKDIATMAKYVAQLATPKKSLPAVDEKTRINLSDPNGYFAKQAEYYGAKGAWYENQPGVSEKRAAASVVDKQAKAKALEAYNLGTSGALQLLQAGVPVAQPLVSSSSGGSGRAAPRVLSDQEIEQMANMIAGGMA